MKRRHSETLPFARKRARQGGVFFDRVLSSLRIRSQIMQFLGDDCATNFAIATSSSAVSRGYGRDKVKVHMSKAMASVCDKTWLWDPIIKSNTLTWPATAQDCTAFSQRARTLTTFPAHTKANFIVLDSVVIAHVWPSNKFGMVMTPYTMVSHDGGVVWKKLSQTHPFNVVFRESCVVVGGADDRLFMVGDHVYEFVSEECGWHKIGERDNTHVVMSAYFISPTTLRIVPNNTIAEEFNVLDNRWTKKILLPWHPKGNVVVCANNTAAGYTLCCNNSVSMDGGLKWYKHHIHHNMTAPGKGATQPVVVKHGYSGFVQYFGDTWCLNEYPMSGN